MDNKKLNLVKEYQSTSNLLKPAFIKEHDINEFEEIIYNYEGAIEVLEFGWKYKSMWEYTHVNLRECMNDLVRIQQKIIATLKKGDDEFKETFNENKWTVYNHIIKLYKELNNPKFVNRYKVWDIPQKGNDVSENGDNCYISEDEIETISVTIKTR